METEKAVITAKMGKLFIPEKVLTNKAQAEAISTIINLNCKVFEKIISSVGVVIICWSEHFREMTKEDKVIPSYSFELKQGAVGPIIEFREVNK